MQTRDKSAEIDDDDLSGRIALAREGGSNG